MKIVGYTALHYSREYLGWAIRSIIDAIDEYHVLYCPHGSHGRGTAEACPDTRDELYSLAHQAAGDKLRWHDGDWNYEWHQRDAILGFAPDADVIVVLDADEIWPAGSVWKTIQDTQSLGQRGILMPLYHYWRSFYRCVVDDGSMPVRVVYPRIHHHSQAGYGGVKLHHFGYAQRPEITRYKWLIHGHFDELRPGWFENVFMANRQTDTHPTNIEYWNPVAVDPWKDCGLPEFMREHPYAGVEVIE